MILRALTSIVLPLALAAGLVACQSIQTERTSARLAVTVATLKVIEADKDNQVERAAKVATIARDAQKLLDGDDVTLTALQTAVKTRLDAAELAPSDRLLADALVAMLADELRARLGDGLLNPEQRVTVSTVLDWVAVAAGG